MMPDTVVIDVALNGDHSRSENPVVPTPTVEVAEEANRCAATGASVVHLHAPAASGGCRTASAWYAEHKAWGAAVLRDDGLLPA